MNKLLSALALAAGLIATPAMAGVTVKEAVGILQESVVPLKKGSQRFCTAFKIGSKTFMTADHCTQSMSNAVKVEYQYVYQFISTVTKPVVRKDKDNDFDWALFKTTTENTSIKALELGCNDDIYIGMPVASMGFPVTLGGGALSPAFVTGYVSATTSPISNYHNSDVTVDMPGAPGASGSPVLNLDTGNVIGVLIELVTGSRDGGIMMGFQSLKGSPVCAQEVNDNKSESNSPKRKYNKEDAIYSPF